MSVSCLYYWLAADWRDNTCRPGYSWENTIYSWFTFHEACPTFNPSMPFAFSCIKKHLPPSPVIWHTTHQLHSVTHIGTRIARKRWAIVWPALNQHWLNASSWLCLDITGLEQCWASVRQWWDADGSLTPYQVPSYITTIILHFNWF